MVIKIILKRVLFITDKYEKELLGKMVEKEVSASLLHSIDQTPINRFTF